MAWLYVMWYATVGIKPQRNTSLLCCEEWCTELSDQILMGRPLLWVVSNFQNVDQLLGFKPVSDSEAEVAVFEVMWWWYRCNFNSHYGRGWPWILVSSIQECQTPSLTLLVCSAAPRWGSDKRREQSSVYGEEWKSGQQSSLKPRCHLMLGMSCDGLPNYLTYSLPCPETNPC